MVTAARVYLWDQYVGALLWDTDSGAASFEFEPGFLRNEWDIAPLTMPISEVRQNRIFSFSGLPWETYHGLPGLLADSLPDKFGHQLINLWLAIQGRPQNSMNPVEMLCYMGRRGMGALEFRPATRFEQGVSQNLEVSELVNLAQQALNHKEDLNTHFTDNERQAMLDIIRVGTSAGGARAKAVIAINKRGNVKSGQLDVPEGYEHWIIKLDGVSDRQLGDPRGYGRIEYAYHKMAVDCGIEMAECRLLEENGRAHFMTRRFDRPSPQTKLHMSTLCGMNHFDYNDPLAFSYEQAFQTLRSLRLPYPSFDQLYRRMVFNVIGINHDDHTKNISFLMDPSGQWCLSPAYDLSYAHNPSHRYLTQHQLSVNNKRSGITLDDLLTVAEGMNIRKSKDIIGQIRGTIKRWPEYASMAHVPENQTAAIGNAHLINI